MRLVTMKSSTSQTTAKVVVCCVRFGVAAAEFELGRSVGLPTAV